MTVLYCKCGHKVWSELWWKEPKDVLLFFGDVKRSETYGEQVTRCPGCGEELRFGLRRRAAGHEAAQRRRETV